MSRFCDNVEVSLCKEHECKCPGCNLLPTRIGGEGCKCCPLFGCAKHPATVSNLIPLVEPDKDLDAMAWYRR